MRVALQPILVCAYLSMVLGAGCAHRSTHAASIDELNRTIQSLRAQNAGYHRQVEELQNQVFILNDQLDSRKVNDERAAPPQLPTVTLRPTETTPPNPPSVEAPGSVAESTLLDQPEIELFGAAAKENAPGRPVLRLYGDETPVFLSAREETKEVDLKPTVRIAGEKAPREPSAPASRPARADPVDLYRQSYDALKAGHHPEALTGFRDFVRQHPAHDLADNAQYWLGECYYDQKDYPAAVREFRRVVEKFPHGNKVPDALLKIGFSYLATGAFEAGRQTLEQLVRSYPRHDAAALATARLAEVPSSTAPIRPARPAQEAP